jgi:prepilin-type N-terminal cleavage/methylation domain-containing protein
MNKGSKISGQRGFTLIELMIVVAIIGILAAVAIPKFAEMLRKSKEGATKGSLTNLRSALTIYISDNEGRTPSLGDADTIVVSTGLQAFTPKYVETIPSVKLGTYHGDTANIVVVSSAVTDRGNTTTVAAQGETTDDANGWKYSSLGGGTFYVNCTHTDTKNVWITNW